jgi:hypothetical protein
MPRGVVLMLGLDYLLVAAGTGGVRYVSEYPVDRDPECRDRRAWTGE